MALFSQRKGIRPVDKVIQRESMDDDLRNCLWNALQLAIWNRWAGPDQFDFRDPDTVAVERIYRNIWMHHFKRPLDRCPDYDGDYNESGREELRSYFFDCEWWQVYDFLEVVIIYSPAEWAERLKIKLNIFLEREGAAYRVVGTEVVEITDEIEIEALENALSSPVTVASQHLSKALQMLSDRKAPDYRNSIKESISAVEAACQSVSGKSNATLTDCLKSLKGIKPLHPAFEQALIKMYSYTSDGSGIRHALSENDIEVTYSDAKFMLVSCSGFVSYLWAKMAELRK